jgi:hypothetical protein
MDDAHSLSLEARKVVQLLGEKDRPHVGDVPIAGLTGLDNAVVLQSLKNRRPAIGEGQFQQIEKGGVVEQAQHLFRAHVLGGNATLERNLVENAPQRPFLFGMLIQLCFMGADPDTGLGLRLAHSCFFVFSVCGRKPSLQ